MSCIVRVALLFYSVLVLVVRCYLFITFCVAWGGIPWGPHRCPLGPLQTPPDPPGSLRPSPEITRAVLAGFVERQLKNSLATSSQRAHQGLPCSSLGTLATSPTRCLHHAPHNGDIQGTPLQQLQRTTRWLQLDVFNTQTFLQRHQFV